MGYTHCLMGYGGRERYLDLYDGCVYMIERLLVYCRHGHDH